MTKCAPAAPRASRRVFLANGFSLVELLIAAMIGAALVAAVLGLVNPARGVFQTQPEISDMHQRLRAALDALRTDLLMAGAGLTEDAPVVPYRLGERDSDPASGVFYRPDAITIRYLPWSGSGVVSHTYELRVDAAADTFQLMRYDGRQGDFPIVDHVVALAFDYFGAGPTPLGPSMLQDGPWIPDESAPSRFDEDLLGVRRVAVRLRVQAALASMRGPSGVLFARAGTSTSTERFAPDREVRLEVALRNANLDR